jgi:hypothetical protein
MGLLFYYSLGENPGLQPGSFIFLAHQFFFRSHSSVLKNTRMVFCALDKMSLIKHYVRSGIYIGEL